MVKRLHNERNDKIIHNWNYIIKELFNKGKIGKETI